jgi:opacity protein-like surface antigen
MASLTKILFAATLLAIPSTVFAEGEPAPDPAAGGGGDATGGGGTAAPTTTTAPEPAAAGGKGSKTLGVDVAGILPLGDYGDLADFAIGGLVRFEFGVNDQLAVTARAGYIYNLTSVDGVSLGMIPILVGGAYKIGTSGLNAYAELGVTNIRVSVDVGGASASDSKTKFSFGVGAGYQMKKIKARVGFFMPGSSENSNGDSSTLYGVMASVGYDFLSL